MLRTTPRRQGTVAVSRTPHRSTTATESAERRAQPCARAKGIDAAAYDDTDRTAAPPQPSPSYHHHARCVVRRRCAIRVDQLGRLAAGVDRHRAGDAALLCEQER